MIVSERVLCCAVLMQMSAGFDWSASVSSQSLDLEFMSLDTVYEIASRVKALVSEAVCVCVRAWWRV